jgi:hypothetical protein|tara:strand:- start:8243 stop:8815 length:573 start_codon:yes stop_codon:yes gene_type:complete
MKKIPTIFLRDPDNLSEVTDDPHPGCEWVFEGEGIATQKYDGTCVLIDKGKYYKRQMIKTNKQGVLTVPKGFKPISHDVETDKIIGWVEVDPKAKENRWHIEALESQKLRDYLCETFELVGPKIQGNPENFQSHCLIPHYTAQVFLSVPRKYAALKEWFKDKDIEGIVFHHYDGRMAKIKKRDFGLSRKE